MFRSSMAQSILLEYSFYKVVQRFCPNFFFTKSGTVLFKINLLELITWFILFAVHVFIIYI